MGVEDYNKEKIELLSQHKMSFDKERVWQNIHKRKKKRRGVFFFTTMALVALAIVFFILGILPFQRLQHDQKASTTGSVQEEHHSLNENTLVTHQLKSHIESVEEKLDGEGVNIDENDPNMGHDKLSNSKVLVDEKSNRNITDNIINSQTIRENISRSENPSQVTTRSSWNGFIASDFLQEKSSTRAVSSPVLETINDNEKTIMSGDKTRDIQSAASIGQRIFGLQYDQIDLEIPDFSTSEITPVNQPSRFSIGVYVGAGSPSLITSDTLPYARDVLETFSIGVDAKYQIKPTIYLRSGLEYEQLTERETNVDVSTFDLSSLDEPIPGITQTEGIATITETSKTFTVYSNVSAPIFLGWNTNRKKFNFFVEGGVHLNLSSYVSGELFEGEERVSGIKILPSVGAGASWKINDRFDLFGRVNWKGARNIAYVSEGRFRMYTTLRGQVGINMRFNKKID